MSSSQGFQFINDGGWYEGEYKDEKYHGHGTYTHPDGSKYEGEWKDGKRNGQGTLTSHDRYKYEGKWKDGKRNGQGTFTHPNGYKYIGDWNKGNFGTGTWYDIKGNILKKYVNGKVTYTVGE